MPNIETFNGVKVNIYYNEHNPPHVHFVFGEYEVLLVIQDGTVYKGWLPGPQLERSKKWLNNNRRDCMKTFKLFNPHLNAPRKTTTKNSSGK